MRRGTALKRALSACLLVGLAMALPLRVSAVMARPLQAEAAMPSPDPEATPTTKITSGCVLAILVTDAPQLSGSFTVDAEGKIHFTLTDEEGGHKEEWDVNVQGRTAEEARGVIAESLKRYILAPEVQVILAKLPRVRVFISGAAQTTGKLDLSPKAHLSDALAACHYKPEADLANIRILRQEKGDGKTPGKVRTLAVNFAAFMRGESQDDPALESGDKIILPAVPAPTVSAEPKLVRIVGEVNREASLPLSPGMTLRDAFDRAGGLKETADREKIRLVRGADGRILEVDADRVLANDPVHNLPLSAGDLIIVGQRDRSLRYAVLGEVLEPNTFDWNPKEKVTLLRALEMAGGLTKKADRRKGLLRKGYLNNPAETRDLPFDLELIAKGKQPDWEIEPGDAVFVLPKQHRPSFLQQIAPLLFRFLPFGL
ncbi:MAG TPA: SLBB domain-containing protein [Chthonomonadaceae bacterium]|nr:SLBB domain-containing protein [Chthonomonadaceae bacterium]